MTVANCPGTHTGLHFKGVSAAALVTDIISDVKVINSRFSNNNMGISARHVQVHGLELLGGSGRTVISENRRQGMLMNADGIAFTGVYDDFVMNKVDFYHNMTNGEVDNGGGDLFFLGFNGDLEVDDVVFTMGLTTPNPTPYYIGMGINGKYNGGSAPAGNMSFKNLVFNDYPGAVHHPRALMGIWTFTNLDAGVELDNVQFNGTGSTQGALSLSGLYGTTSLVIKNSTFAGLSSYVVGSSANQITDIRNVGSYAPVDASENNTFTGAANNYEIEDRIIHKIDNVSNSLVTWVANNTYVTPNSFISPNTTPLVQRGVDAASNGFTVNVGDGTYLGDVILNKGLTLKGESRNGAILKGVYSTGGVATIYIGSTASDNAIVRDLTVTRDYQDWYGSTKNYGVLLSGAVNNVTLDNIVVKDNRNGVYAENNAQLIMLNSIIEQNRTGLHLSNTVRGTVHNNQIRDNQTHGIFYNLDDGTSNLSELTVNDNSITGNWYSQVLFRGANALSPEANFECNWYGIDAVEVNTSNPSEPGYAGLVPQQLGGTAPLASYDGEIRGNGAIYVDYVNWTVGQSGNTSDPYEPIGASCLGTPIEITSLVVVDETCDVTGSITVHFTGGTAPYTITWTGGTASGIAVSPYEITNLNAGSYAVSVEDSYGSMAASSATILGLMVENQSDNSLYTTIQAAIDAANNGDVIYICAGTYPENLIVNKPITLLGAQNGIDPRPSIGSLRTIGGANESIVVAPKNTIVVNIQAGNVVIDGLQITQSGGPGTADAIKAITSQDGITLTNNIVSNAADEAIQLESGDNYTVANNFISNSVGDGITYSSSEVTPLKGTNQKILNNDITGSTSAYGSIYLYGTQNVEIAGNIIHTLSSGIAIGSGDELLVSHTTVHDNEIFTELRTAYSAYAFGISLDGSGTDVAITNNKITKTGSFIPPAVNKDRYNMVRIGLHGTSNPTNISINENYFDRFDPENVLFINASVTNQVDAKCNWYGTALETEIDSRIGGTGAVLYVPYLDGGVDGDIATGFTPTGVCGCPSGNLVTNTNTGEVFCSIQDAIDDVNTQDGDEIIVSQGIYAENIIVNKEVSILGPNALIEACSGTREPEAIIVPASSAISSGEIFHIAASNVTISGLTINGDNTAITSGFSSTNGADIDAAEGITVYETGVNQLTVTNNIIENLSYFGVTLYDNLAAAPSSGHVIANNKIQNLGTYDATTTINYWGGGILLYNNQYANITNNCMTNVRIGIQTGNFSQANPGTAASQVISNNTIEARRVGIFHNLFYGSSSPFTVSDNTITGLADVNESVLWNGILVTSLSGATHNILNNTIDGSGLSLLTTGINIWNDQVAPLLDGNTITGVQVGINVNNFEGYPAAGSNANNTTAVIQGSVISGATIAGILIHDNPANSNGATVTANISNNNIITGSPIGIRVLGSEASATITGNDLIDNVIGVQVTELAQADINTNDFIGTLNQTDIQATATAGEVVASPNNNLSGSAYGIENLSATTIDGTLNYWNDADDSGPGAVGTGSGVLVTSNVDFCPWLDDAAPLGNAVNAAGGTITVTETGGPIDNDGVVCSGETVTLEVTGAQDGSTYLWSTNETTASIDINPTTTTTYTVVVSYGGCETELDYEIIVYPVPTIDLVDLSNVLCHAGNTGSIEVTGATGPAPYTYVWSNGPTTALNADLVAGTYIVTVTDANLCSVVSTPYTVTQPATPLSIISFAINNESCVFCANGTITVNATGGTPPYQYSKDGGATWQTSSFFGGLSYGNYSMVVMDANGCTTTPQNVTITVNGVFADLTMTRFLSTSAYYDGDVSNEVIRIRNKGAGPTYAASVFTVTLPAAATGITLSDNTSISVTIKGDTYTLNNSDFTYSDDVGLGLRTYTTNVILLPGAYMDVGIVHTRSGGIQGDYTSTVKIINGTGGGETNIQNNTAIVRMIKL